MKVGNNDIDAIYIGDNKVLSVYIGNNKIWEVVRTFSPTLQDYSFAALNTVSSGRSIYSSFSELSYITNATSIEIESGSLIAASKNEYATITVFVNEIYHHKIQFETNENNVIVTKTVPLPPGDKFITIRLGSAEGGATGEFISKVTVPEGFTIKRVSPDNGNKRVALLGDSISVGNGTTHPEIKGIIPLMRIDERFNDLTIASYGWGGFSIREGMSTLEAQQKIINNLSVYFNGAEQKILWIQLSTNDYGFAISEPSEIRNWYGLFLDALKIAIPDIQVYAQTAFTRVNENNNNSLGFNMPSYRNAIIDAVSANSRGSYTRIVDGLSIISAAELTADGVHVGDNGNETIADYYIRKIKGLSLSNQVEGSYYITLDGTANDIISVQDSPDITLGSRSQWTVTCWYRRNSVSGNNFFFRQGNVNSAGKSIYFYWNSVNQLEIGNFSDEFKLSPADDLDWHHYSFEYDNKTLSVYQDNFFVGSKILPAGFSGNGATFLGNANTGNTANGDLAKVRLYDHLLSDIERSNDRVKATLDNYDGVLEAWHFANNLNGVKGHNGIAPSPVTYGTTPPPLEGEVPAYMQTSANGAGAIIVNNVNISLANRSNWSLTCKVRRKRSGFNDWIFTQGTEATDGKLLFFGFFNTNNLRFSTYGVGNDIQSETAVMDLNWHHYVINKNGLTITLYQDSVIVASGTIFNEFTGSGSTFIGSLQINPAVYSYLNIDNMRLYDHTLTQSEIDNDRNTGIIPGNGVLAAWNFDNNAEDKTGNGNDGVVGNAVRFIAEGQ